MYDQRSKGQQMNRIAKFTVLGITIAMLGTSITAATAETRWERFHPRRDQVNDRLATQNARINDELREGGLSWRRAAALHREDHIIRGEERFMAHFHDGHITRAEQRALNQQLNGVSRQIAY
jgi:hypothetical protein